MKVDGNALAVTNTMGATTGSVEVDGDRIRGAIGAELAGLASPHGISVRLQSGSVGGVGVLGADGRASLPIVDAEGTPIPEAVAWNHDWRSTTVVVGADVDESVQTRDRVRAYARSRLRHPGADAFLAEILAAESDY